MFAKLLLFSIIGVVLVLANDPNQEDIANIPLYPEWAFKDKLKGMWNSMAGRVKDAFNKISKTFEKALDDARAGISKLTQLPIIVKNKLRQEYEDIRNKCLAPFKAEEKKWEDTMAEWRKKAAEGRASEKEFNDAMAQAQKGLKDFNNKVNQYIDAWNRKAREAK